MSVRVLGIGGSTNPGSSAERALRLVLDEAQRLGADTCLLGGPELTLPPYAPGRVRASATARRLLAEVAAADGIVLASPAYHGGVSGLVKNALDYMEELRDADRPYFSRTSHRATG